MAADVLGGPIDGAISIDDHRALLAITIGPQQADLSFEQRLAHEQGWDLGFAKRAVQEYLRFAYLCVHAGPCTPSVEVDQVWHLHLTYSRDYWGEFCPNVLGAELHHGPTAGGQVERARYYDQYAATLKAYEEAFGEAPPADIWPDARRRFEVDPAAFRINPSDAVILPVKVFVVALFLAAALGVMLGWIVKGFV